MHSTFKVEDCRSGINNRFRVKPFSVPLSYTKLTSQKQTAYLLKWHPLRDDSVTAFVTSKRTEVFVMQTNGCWKTRYEGNDGLALAHGAAIAGRMDDGRIGGPLQLRAGQTTGSQTNLPRWQEHIIQRPCSACRRARLRRVCLRRNTGSLPWGSRCCRVLRDEQTRAGHLDVSQPTWKLGVGRAGTDDGASVNLR